MPSASESFRVGILAICINVWLIIIKIGGNSYALVADAIESASDIFSSVITGPVFVCHSNPLMRTTRTELRWPRARSPS
jgi:divalent metal cation (Fe/Co/Zn/Cd) transporter